MCERKTKRSRISHQDIVSLYTSGKSVADIALAADISDVAVRYHLKKSNVVLRKYSRRKYDPDVLWSKYSSGLCLNDLVKLYGGTQSTLRGVMVRAGHKLRTVKETVRRGCTHPFWTGGIRKSTDGYRVTEEGRLHRLVLEEVVGRKLHSWEDVHHVDGDKVNYNISNLVVMTTREHSRFHMFLRHRGMSPTRALLDTLCRRESEYLYRFTTNDCKTAHSLFPLPNGRSVRYREKRVCSVRGCGSKHFGKGLCSKHWQRQRAEVRGYWLSGGGKKGKLEKRWLKRNNNS